MKAIKQDKELHPFLHLYIETILAASCTFERYCSDSSSSTFQVLHLLMLSYVFSVGKSNKKTSLVCQGNSWEIFDSPASDPSLPRRQKKATPVSLRSLRWAPCCQAAGRWFCSALPPFPQLVNTVASAVSALTQLPVHSCDSQAFGPKLLSMHMLVWAISSHINGLFPFGCSSFLQVLSISSSFLPCWCSPMYLTHLIDAWCNSFLFANILLLWSILCKYNLAQSDSH